MDQHKGKEGENEAREKLAWLLGLTPGGGANNNVNTLKVEGAGKLMYGLAIGIPLGATIAFGAWIVSSQQDMRESIRQAESYRSAVYMLAPRFAEEIDKELDQRKTRHEQYSDPDQAAEEARPAGR